MFPSTRNYFSEQQPAVSDRISAVGDVQTNRLHDQAVGLLSSPESSTIFRNASNSSGTSGLHHLELTDSGARGGAPNQADGLVMTEAQGHRMSHNEQALGQMNDDQVSQVAQLNPTSEAVETLVDRNPQEAETLANQRPEVLSSVMNNDEIDENFQQKMKRDVIGA